MNAPPPERRRVSARPGDRRWRRLVNAPLLAAIYGYRLLLGPWLGGHCRFYPTCSQYALDAYRLHGPLRGSWLTLRRLARCHPFGGRGVDPVPEPEMGDKNDAPAGKSRM